MLFIKRMHTIIFNILKPYFDDEKYKLNMYVYFVPSFENATMHASTEWSKVKINMRGDERRVSDITIFLLSYMIYRMKDNKKTLITQISNDLSHEITHLIHSLKSSNKNVTAKSQYRGSDIDKRYRAKPTEIEAFAQSTASGIYKKAKTMSDPVEYIETIFDYLQLGSTKLYGIKLFSDPDYEMYKKLFQTENKFDQRIWKTYKKKLIQKLMFYKEELAKRK